jgi:hypothetical protein
LASLHGANFGGLTVSCEKVEAEVLQQPVSFFCSAAHVQTGHRFSEDSEGVSPED